MADSSDDSDQNSGADEEKAAAANNFEEQEDSADESSGEEVEELLPIVQCLVLVNKDALHVCHVLQGDDNDGIFLRVLKML